jgi:hypothetical protein
VASGKAALDFSAYIGAPLAKLLQDPHLAGWQHQSEVEDDLPDSIVCVSFPGKGLEVQCNLDQTIRSIFLSLDGPDAIDAALSPLDPALSRRQVRKRLGPTERSGEGHQHAILGTFGPFDRFLLTNALMHVEFHADADKMTLITFVCPSIAP